MHLHSIGIDLYLRLRHLGVVPCAAALLIGIASAIWFSFIPHLRAEIGQQQNNVERAKNTLNNADSAPPIADKPLVEVRAQTFYSILSNKSEIEQNLKILFELADHVGLRLHQADYKSLEDKNGSFHTYHIQLPVAGPYHSIRQFCETTLLAFPFASLDEMSFKRDAISTGNLEAKLRFTFYLLDQRPIPVNRPTPVKGAAA